MLMLAQQQVTLSLLKANPIDPAYTDRYTYRPAVPAQGLGVGLTTYRGDGNPLPSFTGDPLLLPCAGHPEDLLDTYWEALDVTQSCRPRCETYSRSRGRGYYHRAQSHQVATSSVKQRPPVHIVRLTR